MDRETAGALLRDLTRLYAQVQRDSIACCGGTTGTQCHIITEVGRGGAMTLAELGRRLGLDKGWLSRAVEALVQEGVIAKDPNPDDRRAVLLTLTPAGQERYAELNRTLNAQAGSILDRIPAAERPAVARALHLLLGAIEAEAQGANTPIHLEDSLL